MGERRDSVTSSNSGKENDLGEESASSSTYPLNEHTTELIITLSSERTYHRLIRPLQVAGIIVAVLTSLGLFGFSELIEARIRTALDLQATERQPLVEAKIREIIRTSFAEDEQARRDFIEKEISYFTFLQVAAAFKDATGISIADSDRSISLLKKIIPHQDLIEREGFLTALEIVVDTLSSAEMPEKLEEVINIAESQAISSAGIVHSLVIHYGGAMIGHRGLPDENFDKLAGRFKTFATAAKSNGLRETAMPYEMMAPFVAAKLEPTESVSHFIDSLKFWKGEEVSEVLFTFILLANPEVWVKRMTEQPDRLGFVADSFFKTYWDELIPLLEKEEVNTPLLNRLTDADPRLLEYLVAVTSGDDG